MHTLKKQAYSALVSLPGKISTAVFLQFTLVIASLGIIFRILGLRK